MTKTLNIVYNYIESANEEYFSEVSKNMKNILKSSEPTGSFDTNDAHYVWRINNRYDFDSKNSNDVFYISLLKEKTALPVWFNDNAEISEIPKNDGMIGELFYAFFSPENKYILSMSASGGGGSSTVFKKFLNEFSRDMNVRLIPVFEKDVDKQVLNWGYYKSLKASIMFPTHDDLAEFNTSKEGRLLTVIDELGGLKIDINIAAPKAKQMLNAYQVKEFISSMLPYELCTKLKVRGGEYDEVAEEIDLKNAIVSYSKKVIMNGSYIEAEEGVMILTEALMKLT